MKFADFYVGQVIEAGPHRVEEDEVLRFAEAYDPQWFHVDRKKARMGPYGGLIASGWHTCSIAMRLSVDAVLAGSDTVGSPGVAYIKWLNPVRPGDSLTLRAEVLEKRRSSEQAEPRDHAVAVAALQPARPGGARIRGDEPVRPERSRR